MTAAALGGGYDPARFQTDRSPARERRSAVIDSSTDN